MGRSKNTSKTGPLNNNEKFKIQEMYLDGISSENIAEKLSRTNLVINNYIESLKNKINKAASIQEKERVTRGEANQKDRKEKLNKFVETAKKRARQEGLTNEQIELRLSHIMSQKKPPKTEEDIYQSIIIYKPFMEMVGTLTKGAHSGRVSIMTEAASERIDKSKQKKQKNTELSRMTRGACYPTKKGT